MPFERNLKAIAFGVVFICFWEDTFITSKLKLEIETKIKEKQKIIIIITWNSFLVKYFPSFSSMCIFIQLSAPAPLY
jgi:hypothetical protein